MSAWVIDLLRRGIKPAALGIISGAYDTHYSNYAYMDIHDREQLQPYVAALPRMALTNYYHQGRLAMDDFEQGTRPEELYEKAAEFARTTYAHHATVRPGNPPDEVLEQLVDYIGFSKEVLLERNLRIDPDFFCKNYIPDKQLSALDTRFSVTKPFRGRIDPLIDATEMQMIYMLGERSAESRGYSSDFRYAVRNNMYVPIIEANPWEYSGLWADGRAYRGMQTVLEQCPELRVIETRGMFDLNTVYDGFWDDMREQGTVGRVTHHYGSNRYGVSKFFMPGVDSYLLRMGHMLTDNQSRMQILELFSNLASTVQQEANRGY